MLHSLRAYLSHTTQSQKKIISRSHCKVIKHIQQGLLITDNHKQCLFCSFAGNRFQRSTIGMFITLIWLYALLWAACPLLGWGGYGPEPYGMACSVDWAGYQNSLNDSTFIMALAVLCTILPCVAIVSSYLGITWKLHKAYQTIQNNDRLPTFGNVEKKVMLVSPVWCPTSPLFVFRVWDIIV